MLWKRRACGLFDKIVVAIAKNESKNPLFTLEDRIKLAKNIYKENPKVEEIEEIQESYQGNEKVCLKVTDSSNMLFSVIVPKVLLPSEFKAGDVARITKVAKSREG